jgi:DNA-binding IclR family transcriptional regulator
LDKRTDKTITDPDKLLKEFEKIRNQGYCISNEENAKGALGIGAPVRNSKGEVVASIAAAGIKAGIDNNRLNEIKKVIMEAAEEISALIP